MTAHSLRLVLSLLALAALLDSGSAAADDAPKDVCIDAHSRGQDAREQGKISMARMLFITCAQSQCPALVQDDCARFADELNRLQPWLNFAARDVQGNDLPDTAVYVDEQLLLTRLDDGKPHAVDPGKHLVRFSHAGRDEAVTVVVGAGEKGRTVTATFATPPSGSDAAPVAREAQAASAAQTSRPRGARALVIGGAALAAVGSTLGIIGLARVPESCSLSSHDCAAPPGDPSFDDAAKAVRISNVGWSAAGIGAAALAAGLVWFFKRAEPASGEADKLVAPLLTPGGGGLSFAARL
jgi:hypothetical protein